MNAIRYNVETVLFYIADTFIRYQPNHDAMIAPVTYSVRGKVIDRQSRQPVAYANVFRCRHPGREHPTDSLGTSRLEQVPPGSLYALRHPA